MMGNKHLEKIVYVVIMRCVQKKSEGRRGGGERERGRECVHLRSSRGDTED